MSILNSRIKNIISKNYKNYYSFQGVNYPLKLEILNSFLGLGKKVLFVAQNESTALSYRADFASLFNIDATFLPASQNKFYEDVPNNPYIYFNQIQALNSNSNFIIADFKALFEKFPTSDFFQNNSIKITKGDTLDYSKIRETLVKFGYKSSSMVSDIGEFSLRGDILDIYTFSNYPFRVEFFSDTIEDIRTFDAYSQKSIESVNGIEVFPLYKFILDEDNSKTFSSLLKKAKYNELLETFEESRYFDGIEYYSNFFNSNLYSPFEYFKDYIVIFDDFTALEQQFKLISDNLDNEFEQALKSPLKFPLNIKNHNTFSDILNSLSNFIRFSFDSFMSDFEIIEFKTLLLPDFTQKIEILVEFISEKNKKGSKINICTSYKERLISTFKEFEVDYSMINFYPQISRGGLFENFAGSEIIYLTDRELFNKHTKQTLFGRYTKNKQSADFIESINDIKEGDYVVHSIHGIGLFVGLSKINVDDFEKDYLTIQFQGSDRLYVPAEQINLLKRYRGDGQGKPSLTKMGGLSWKNTKSKVKKDADLVAQELVNLYAKRKMSEGIKFDEDTTWQVELEDAFEWVETPDQLKAIIDTKEDMESPHPMDRLICADVGYGKTEVALRAMFKAVMSGYQALMVAPTTILSHQHYLNIKERFKPFSLVVEELSRFKTKKEQKEILEKLKDGKVDVVIGTHRLLQDDVFPKKIGLLVIDEEHKFGVRHKEKLKTLRQNIDVLSLSATPIPRTLNMALSGIKSLSVINTPPINRLPIKTYVGEKNDKYIKSAIEAEILRQGQVFYLYNRVETILEALKYLKEVVPNARIAVAHGKMTTAQLETILDDFVNLEYDVLLSTTIIESGIDIPNVNTIIIENADRFGLAQLYQLRGRVGRSDRQAFCYCFYPPNKVLTEDATKRLKAIKDFTSLGSGYQIALRDIEFRGVGNLFGAKQHGHMLSVGFDTYCDILDEAISEIKAKKEGVAYKAKNPPAIIDINANAFIPDGWVGSYDQKMLEYKRLADVSSLSELEETVVSFKDRFSKLPESVENLVKLIKLRILATNLGIFKIQETPDLIRILAPYSQPEWNILKFKLKREIVSKFTYKISPKGISDYKGILVLNKNYDDFDKIFNILSDLMYDISNIIKEIN